VVLVREPRRRSTVEVGDAEHCHDLPAIVGEAREERSSRMGPAEASHRPRLRDDEITSLVHGAPVGVLATVLDLATARLEGNSAERLASCRAGQSSFHEAALSPRRFVEAALFAIRSLPSEAQETVVEMILSTGAETALGSDQYRLPPKRSP
jgi:hypothetical protein